MPEVSVIIPCYNQADYLTQSLNSVRQQTIADWECIVINDGSTDETRSIALSLATDDPRVRLFEQQNRGLAAARNRGLDEVRGSFIQFLDADDWIAPTKFEQQLAALKTTAELSLSYCHYDRHVEDPNRQTPYVERFSPSINENSALQDLASRWENELSIPAHCFLFDARFFSQRGIRFDETLGNHEDWDCWMQILALRPKVFTVPESLATYRFRAGSMSTDLRSMRSGFLKAVRKQKKAFRDDAEMQLVLTEKLQSVKSEYRDFTLPKETYREVKRRTVGVAKELMPEGVRQMLKNASLNN